MPFQQSVITAEIERWPEAALTREPARHPAFMNHGASPIAANRLAQKQLFSKPHLPIAPWQSLFEHNEWPVTFDRLSELAIVKRRTGSYNGRGQWRSRVDETGQLPAGYYDECIVEQDISFSGEVLLVDVHGSDDSTMFCPLTHNLHQNSILCTGAAFPQANTQQQAQTKEILSAIMQELSCIGMIAMRCPVTPRGLLINGLTPRMHNSRYWTQSGVNIDQFELRLRVITDLLLPQPIVDSPSTMTDLTGSGLNYNWLKLPSVYLHWYDKKVRPGREVGHSNSADSDTSRLTTTLGALIPLLPPEYANGVMWTRSKFSQPGT